jgi:hypothetical protein
MQRRRSRVPACLALATLLVAGCSKKKGDEAESPEPTAAAEKPRVARLPTELL